MRRILFIFGQLSDDDCEWIANNGDRVEVPTGGVLIQQGVHAPSLYFLIVGKMAVEVAGVGTVATLGSGEVLGEMSFIDSNPPGATVRALEDSLLLGINKITLTSHMEATPGFFGRFYKALAIFLSNRLRDTTNRMRGAVTNSNDEEIDEGLLDDEVLKTVHLASYRFNRLVQGIHDR